MRVPIKDWEGWYEIDEDGNVYSVDRILTNSLGWTRTYSGQKIKPFISDPGYVLVSLSKPGVGKRGKRQFFVHRLIAIAFIPNPLNLPFINHIDGNKSNNKIKNLEWVTSSENYLHAMNVLGTAKPGKNFPKGEKHRSAVLNEMQVIEIKRNYKLGDNKAEMARKYNVAFNTIKDIVNGKTWKHIL